jgi:hypothetical protein
MEYTYEYDPATKRYVVVAGNLSRSFEEPEQAFNWLGGRIVKDGDREDTKGKRDE